MSELGAGEPTGHRVGGTVCICSWSRGVYISLGERSKSLLVPQSHCSNSIHFPLLAKFLKTLLYQRHGKGLFIAVLWFDPRCF